MEFVEPILDPKNVRFTTLPANSPIEYPKIWENYLTQLGNMWKASEINFSEDYDDFVTLTPGEQHYIKRILAFFASTDGIVNMNLGERFISEITIMEARVAYRFQAMMEDVHGLSYSLMLKNIVRDEKERDYLFNSMKNIETIKNMTEWALKWEASEKAFAHRVVAFAAVEGILFSGAFASIYWLKAFKTNNKNKSMSSTKPFMNGLCKSNEFIARDEGLHCALACEVYGCLVKRLPRAEILEILLDAVKLSKEFMKDALDVGVIGMCVDDMDKYIEYVCDTMLIMLGYDKHYNTKNPLHFMNTIGILGKTNFHETRPTEYQGIEEGEDIDDDDF